ELRRVQQILLILLTRYLPNIAAVFSALSDAVLSCEFRTEKDQNPRIEWKKRGKAVTFVYFNNKFTGRAKIEGATLTIHSVTQKDSGEYRCEVTASEDHVNLGEATVNLNVLVPPHVPSCDVPSSVFVGSGLELLCKDKMSVPPATYRWYKDNRALTATAETPYSIDTNKGTLKFKSVSKLDAGMYRCESSNSVGAPKSCVAQQLKVVECRCICKIRLSCFTDQTLRENLCPSSRSVEHDDPDSRSCRFRGARPFLLHRVCLPPQRLLPQ
uniref:Junctional adhesion molecule 2b n=1 Tax=Amphiprion percula TaxID=161767 RepID=A0A3P8SEK3_AMPPE